MEMFHKGSPHIYKAILFAVLTSAATQVTAGVKFRINFDKDTHRYGIYMTPDSIPNPDMLLSSQITVVAPHQENAGAFTAHNIQSDIPGVSWVNHSHVDGPLENPNAAYLSLGYFFTGSTPPNFHWVTGEEKRILSFESVSGCSDGVHLLENNDPFNQLPNSAGTNPGNDFMNVGWTFSNAYMGNYGSPIFCGTLPQCEPTAMDQYYLTKIATLEGLKLNSSPARQQRIDVLINNLESKLSCNS